MQWIKKHKRVTGTVTATSLFLLLFWVLQSFGGDSQLAKVQELKKQLSGEQAKKLPPEQRALRLVASATSSGGSATELDRSATRALSALGAPPPTRTLLFGLSQLGKEVVSVGAVDGLGNVVELESGRLPGPCSQVM